MTLWNEDVQFPKRCKPLPPGYKIIQLDSGHYLWTWGTPEQRHCDDYELEGFRSWDKWWVRRCAFMHFKEKQKEKA